MNKGVLTVSLAMLAGLVVAQPYFVRGSFNGWTNDSNPMVDMGDGLYEYTVTGLNPGQMYEFKATVADWSVSEPDNNARAVANASGELKVTYRPTAPADGWNPADRRLGYYDPGHGWEIMGSFNGWSAPAVTLNSWGGGLFTGTGTFAPGTYEFKFRKTGDWDVTITNDFSGTGGNISLTVTEALPQVNFFLDLPGGRWKTEAVPEPATLAALGLGVAALMRRRRQS